ncbi:hypothetical protein GCM10007933_07990 [Zoogloea oryzae]|uniref:Helix-turn-helix domain-containing protein n=1 Tax=Zoogloea oryzae TaxID=310767 RepID=A0ABQ6F7X9_9RHOO|nr:hypothetical protein GCM10007933_07990 [Zoogloea oryzae]
MIIIRNPVRDAVERVGGPTKASNLLNVSNGTIHAWIKARRVADIDLAKRLAQFAKMDVQEIRPAP